MRVFSHVVVCRNIVELASGFGCRNTTPSSKGYKVSVVTYTSALTVSFAEVISGQHAVDDFFWRGESFVTLNRKSQKRLENKGEDDYYLNDQGGPILVFSYSDLCVRMLQKE